MTKLEQAAKAYAEAHAWAEKCGDSQIAALSDYQAVTFGKDEDQKRRYCEATRLANDAIAKMHRAEMRLRRVARGEE